MKTQKLFALLLTLTLVFLLAFTACSSQAQGETQENPNAFRIGDMELYFKNACIMSTEAGEDALVLTYDCTNSSKETTAFASIVCENAQQNGKKLEWATAMELEEQFPALEEAYTDIEPGVTLEVSSAYLLRGAEEVTVSLTDLWNQSNHTYTLDLTSLQRVETESVSQENSSEKQENSVTQLPEKETVELTESQDFSDASSVSIDVLREELLTYPSDPALFGMAYIGYFEYSPEAGIDYNQWFYHASTQLGNSYPFIWEIDEAHTIGTEGHLYCVIPQEYGASLSVRDLNSGEVLYRSENSDPILVFCNRDGDARKADTVVTIISEDGNEYDWKPTLDELGFPDILVGDERRLLSWNLKDSMSDRDFSLDSWAADGWLGPTQESLGFEQNGSWNASNFANDSLYYLDLHYDGQPASMDGYDGVAELQFFYLDDPMAQAKWEGSWKLETQLDQPSRLYLDLTLIDDSGLRDFTESTMISESYEVLIHPSGEYLLLLADDRTAQLPLFSGGFRVVELFLSMG